MTTAQKARKYWHDNLKKYRQRVLNRGRLQYRVDLPSMLDGAHKEIKGRDLACYWIEVTYNDPCGYCGAPATETDHIVPIQEIGMRANRWDNLTACCRNCNSTKHTKSLLHFLREVKLKNEL